MKNVAWLVLLFFPLSIFAQDSAEEEKPVSVDAEFGMLFASGNTESSSTLAKLNITHDLTKWKNNYILESFFQELEKTEETNGVVTRETQTTGDRLFGSFRTDYKLSGEHSSLFGYASYEDDGLSGFKYQATVSFGYSNRLFETEKSNMDYAFGPAHVWNETDDGVKTESFAARVAFSYVYNFSDSAKFTQDVSSNIVGSSDENTSTKSVSSVTANLNSNLAIKFSYTMQHNSEPPEDKENLDIVTSASLVFSY